VKKNIFISIVIATIALFMIGQSHATSIITGLLKTGGDTDPAPFYPVIVSNGLVPGAISYVDREGRATWQGIPLVLLGIDYIITENDDKNSGNTGEVYSVTLGMSAFLHVFVDQRLVTPNSSNRLNWLLDNSVVFGGFQKSGQIIVQDFIPFNPQTYNFDVWTASVVAGTYNLGEQTGGSMYGIAASPIPEPGTLLLLGTGLLGLGVIGSTRYKKTKELSFNK
jgi:hypothetical protein